MPRKTSLLFCLLMLFAFTNATSAQSTPPDYFPTEDWRTDSPANRGMDETILNSIADYVASDLPYLDSILIIRDGYIVYENYYNGHDVDTLHHIFSVTKSWTSALVGVAQAQGVLSNLDATLPELLPDYFEDGAHADKREISLRHLLMMRSGIEFNDDLAAMGQYGSPEELFARDVTAFGLDFPIADVPGETWNYSTLDTQLISAIVQHAIGEPLEALIVPSLFEPMGIDEFTWEADATGTTIGGRGLNLTPRDMAKLGLLYLHNGMWDGEQLVPAEWVEESLTPQNTEAYYLPTEQNEIIEWYAYQWWTWKPDWYYGYGSFQAVGYGGQQVFVFPELELIFVTTANGDVDPETGVQQEIGIGKIILDYLFPALTDAPLDHEIHIER